MRKPVLRRGSTIWLSQRPPARYPILRGHQDTEVAIIGGGITGAMTAQAFAERGVKVILVEAARVGQGSTAASTALLLQEPDYDLKALSDRYGSAAAQRIWQLSHDAARDFITTIRRLKIACDLRKRDSLYYTLNDDRVRLLKREVQRRRAAGLPGRWIGEEALLRASGIRGAGAIKSGGNAQLNPFRACVGLLAAAVKDGATVYERSTIKRIRNVGDRVRLYSAHGTIDATQVVIATGYATRSFRPLAGRFKMRHTYVMATNPITRIHRQRLGLGKLMLWDTERPYHYVRWTSDHRLLLGGEDRPVRQGAQPSRQFAAALRDLHQYFTTLFPTLDGIGIDRAWQGLFAMTPDGLPYIGRHRRYPRHAFALGYGGNGMTFAALAARMLVEQWRGITSADHRLFAFGR